MTERTKAGGLFDDSSVVLHGEALERELDRWLQTSEAGTAQHHRAETVDRPLTRSRYLPSDTLPAILIGHAIEVGSASMQLARTAVSFVAKR